MFANMREFVANKIEDRGRFISSEELNNLDSEIKRRQIRLDAAQTLGGKINQLKAETLAMINQKFLVPSGLNYYQDIPLVGGIINAFLNSITQCILAEDKEYKNILDENILNWFDEYIKSVDHPASWYIEALHYIKAHHGLKNEAEKEVNTYIDYLISGLS